MLRRHEYLAGSIKVDRDRWIATRLAAMTLVCAAVVAGVFWLVQNRRPHRTGTPAQSGIPGDHCKGNASK